jgi:hypothetical protein
MPTQQSFAQRSFANYFVYSVLSRKRMSPKAKRFAFEDAHALGCIATFPIQEDIE